MASSKTGMQKIRQEAVENIRTKLAIFMQRLTPYALRVAVYFSEHREMIGERLAWRSEADAIEDKKWDMAGAYGRTYIAPMRVYNFLREVQAEFAVDKEQYSLRAIKTLTALEHLMEKTTMHIGDPPANSRWSSDLRKDFGNLAQNARKLVGWGSRINGYEEAKALNAAFRHERRGYTDFSNSFLALMLGVSVAEQKQAQTENAPGKAAQFKLPERQQDQLPRHTARAQLRSQQLFLHL